MKKKILIITGSRAEFGLLEPIYKSIETSSKIYPSFLVTGMHTLKSYGSTLDEIRDHNVRVVCVVPITHHGTMLTCLNQEISGIQKYCKTHKPDSILLLGDRTESLAAALVASHLNIPIAHIHGGDTSGDVTIDDASRDVITRLSTIHFPINTRSAKRIKKILPTKLHKNIHIVGYIGQENITSLVISRSKLAEKLNLDGQKPWITFVLHSSPLSSTPIERQITEAIGGLRNLTPQIVGILPNSDDGSDIFIKKIKSSGVFYKVFPTLPRKDYISLLLYSSVLVGNSSSFILEAPVFNTSVVMIGERQKDRGTYTNMQSVKYNAIEINKAIYAALNNNGKKNINSRSISRPSIRIKNYLERFLNET